jgi:predicted nucleic acid-binding Zn ribbon protein
MGGIGRAIDSALKEHDLEAAIRPHRAVVLWAEIVGEVLAAASEAEVVRSGVLFVRARSTTWANELTFYKAEILQKINQRLGGKVIEDIHFKAGGRRPARSKRPEPAIAPKGPTDSELSAVRLDKSRLAALPDTLDDRLRHTLERAAQTYEWKRAQGWRTCARCGALCPPADERGGLCPLCALL